MCTYEFHFRNFKNCELLRQITTLQSQLGQTFAIEIQPHIIKERLVYQCPMAKLEQGPNGDICPEELLTEKTGIDSAGITTNLGPCPICAQIEKMSKIDRILLYSDPLNARSLPQKVDLQAATPDRQSQAGRVDPNDVQGGSKRKSSGSKRREQRRSRSSFCNVQ